jgi:ribosomal protein S18 acetylase RimI-like enzyme
MSAEAIQPEVRLAVEADTREIAHLVERYWRFEQIEGFDADEIQKLLGRLVSQPQFGAVWLATMGRDPVGYAVVTFMFSLEHRGMMAEIDELFVLPEARSYGVGSSLLAACEKYLWAREFVRLQLQIDRDNHLARSFYRRHGFEDRAGYQLLDKPLATRTS